MAAHHAFKYGRNFAKGFIIALPLCITFTDNVCSVAKVHGISMQPSLNPEYKMADVIVLSRWAFWNIHGINRGDVVSLVDPHDPDITLIKRVIALEGDVVKTTSYKNRHVTIPRGHCWVEGDNRSHSLDSNIFGPVAVGLIQAKATRILWPPNRWGRIESGLPKGREPLGPSETRHLDEELEDDENKLPRRPEEQKRTEKVNIRQTDKDQLPDYAFLPEKNRTSHSINDQVYLAQSSKGFGHAAKHD